MNLLQRGDFTLASGQVSKFKIDCDALTDEDIETIAWMIQDNLRPKFGSVEGVPTGGYRLAEAMKKYCTPDESTLLIVDDVWTTGGSMRKWRGGRYDAYGAVIFARQPVEPWVLPLFTMEYW